MYQKKLEADLRCPLELGISIFGGKWKSRILCNLNLNGAMRFGVLQESLQDISDPVLTTNLKELSAQGLIERIQYNEIPLRVEYSLTDRGRSLIPLFQEICSWTRRNLQYEGGLPEHCERCVKPAATSSPQS